MEIQFVYCDTYAIMMSLLNELSSSNGPLVVSRACRCKENYMLRSFGVIWIRISDPRSVWIMCIKETADSTLVMDSPVPLMHPDTDRSWITDPDLDHPKGTQPYSAHSTRSMVGEEKHGRKKGAGEPHL